MGPTAGLETWKIYLFIFLLLPKIEPQIFCLPVRSQVTILITAPSHPAELLMYVGSVRICSKRLSRSAVGILLI